jgi:hypothetical protein
MRKLVLIAGVGSFVIGMAILLYDFHFSHCYGEDVNDVAVVQQGKTFDWPTGERPLYTVFPAWFYGVAFVLIATVFLILRLFLPNRVKTFAFLAASLATAFSSLADTSSLENFSPHLSTNTPIIWQAPTNHLPKSFWIYRRLGPRIFPATVISNAIVLGSLQSKGFPQPSTNQTCFTADEDANYPWGHPCIFFINPASANLYYTIRHPDKGSVEDIPSDEGIVKRARDCALQLGVDPAQVVEKGLTSHFNSDTNGVKLTNQICGRGVNLSRQLDGICFWGNGDDSSNGGFWIEFGSHGKIRGFSLTWPSLERYRSQPTASPQQIIACIRAHKIIVIPNADEEKYFERVKTLANAKKFTITKITPYYGEGVFGEVPTNNEPSKYVSPVAELEALADFGNSNLTVRLFSPGLSSDAIRLLTVKIK